MEFIYGVVGGLIYGISIYISNIECSNEEKKDEYYYNCASTYFKINEKAFVKGYEY